MDAPAPLPPDVLAALPPAVVALIHWQAEQIARLTARVAELEAKLCKDSTNSSKPPSAAHPHAKPPSSKPKSGRKRGGQPGHDKHERALIPTEQCQDLVLCVPTECRRCGKELAGADSDPLRHQVWELPEIQPIITEYQQHRLVCSCGCSTCGELPLGVPTGQAGPRLIAFTALLMACFRQSKRRASQFLGMILNQPASSGWMVLLQNRAAAAVEPAYNELADQLAEQPVLHIDESPTKEGLAKAWVWTFVTTTFTFFTCRTSRAADVPKELLGEDFGGIINCDRARMYWAFDRLQWCWAHLKRDFQAWIDGPCPTAKRLGYDLMKPTNELFALWKKVRDGTISRRSFRRKMQPIRQRVDTLLLRGYYNALTRSFCKELVEHREHLWTFIDVEGVEPTNNAAEQALRHAVIWRKLSFGTQSKTGSRFVERLLTVIETCRRQSRDVFSWLVSALRAYYNKLPRPSLLPLV
jgi:transposase